MAIAKVHLLLLLIVILSISLSDGSPWLGIGPKKPRPKTLVLRVMKASRIRRTTKAPLSFLNAATPSLTLSQIPLEQFNQTSHSVTPSDRPVSVKEPREPPVLVIEKQAPSNSGSNFHFHCGYIGLLPIAAFYINSGYPI